MPKIYKQNCIQCKKYYEGYGKFHCSNRCMGISRIGRDNSFYGRKHTKEWRKNHGRVMMGKLSGNKNPMYGKRGENCPSYGLQRSLETRKKISENHYNMLGENNPNWNGGISFEEYPQEFNKELKEYIRQRDNYICQGCWKTEEEEIKTRSQNLSIHHIDYNKKNCQENNLITVCHSCNARANYNRSKWTIFYQNLIHLLIAQPIYKNERT